jgi:plasmid stabilization system protein ParE
VSRFRNFAPQAAADLDDAVGWLLDNAAAPAMAERLLSAVLEAGERPALRPQLGRRRPDLLPDPFRFWSLPRFGLLLVYDPTTSPALILRVLHTARDLGPMLADLAGPPQENAPPDKDDPSA